MKNFLPLVLILFALNVFSQNDCSDALIVCGNSGFQDLDATGFGTQELNGSNTCSSEENNSLWLKIVIKTSGTLGFTLTPTNSNGSVNTDINEDFDFFIFGPNVNCGNIGQAIRCSTTNPIGAGLSNNLTGMNGTETDTAEGPSADGNSFVKWLTVNANDSYFIVIDRPIGNSNFKIDWTGTATFSDPPVVNAPVSGTTFNLEECDDNFADTIEAANFNLSQNENTIKGNQVNVNVSYHLNANDAQTNTNPITNITNFRNTSNPQTIFTRLTNSGSECFSVTNFQLIVKNTFDLNEPTDYFSCDDLASASNTDGFSEDFLLRSKDSEILGSLDASKFTISYHKTLSDAENNLLPIDKSIPYKNETKNKQSIFVRVVSDKGCINTTKKFNLIVNPVPKLQTIPTYIQCDYDSNSIDGFTTFNLASKEAQLTGGATGVTVDFFEGDDTPILNKVGYINRDAANVTNHVLKVKITNTATGCFQFGTLELKVTPTSGSFNTFDNIYEPEINISTSPRIVSEGSNDAVFNFDKQIDKIILASRGAFNKTDNQFSFYLSRDDAEKEINTIKPPYNTYRYTNNTDIFLRISKNNTCEGIGTFKLIVLEIPEPMGNTTTMPLCINFPDNIPILETKPLNGSTGVPTDTYKWYLNDVLISGETNQILNANKEGTYKVEASRFYENGAGSKDDVTTIGYNTFTLKKSSVAVIKSIKSKDDNDFEKDNTLTINVSGKGNYEYALNSNAISNFKKGKENLSYTFTNVKPGLNTVYIRDTNNCGIVASKEQSFIYFQRHFSPNRDGNVDLWKIQGIENTFYKTVDLKIFDRYGNLLKRINQKTEGGWNGIANGKIMPSNDYWYHAVLIDKDGNIREKKGNFSLIRK
ncbi:T9SS type B sorting domain-containing protein [Polaribacter cellanae]|uniref:T9SS type B sorting domain-containing protein n=1 Tax=Polaribacter cellanae TaxID=2818493 RepID=A0A975H9I7_9FLAO|nr:T9SS type B sorting domain-containing protein [Polaribacter cellanae]QTE22950.1 T9SS type B sorting domain-containing protein [Polaribacter cellanae]